MTDIVAEDIIVPARDEFELATTLYRPSGDVDRVFIMNSATAVPRRFYRYFARALAEAGYLAITYDYRGVGDSRPESLRGFEAQMHEWGLLDMAGMIDWAHDTYSPEKIFLGGHSVGGQVAGLLDNSHLVDGMLSVSSQSGHWRLQGAEQKYMVALHVHITLPLLTHLAGYMPWSWLNAGEDLPKGVALQWARWARHRKYLLGDSSQPLERFDSFTAPVLAYSIDDDKWGSARAVDGLMLAYPNVERRHLVPADEGVEKLGHVGYFRPAASALWRDAITWLDNI